MDPQLFLAQVFAAIQSFGGLPSVMKISIIVTLCISSMKVTFLNQMIWSKLGSAQAFVAPVLGLVAGILGIGAGHVALTLPVIFAYLAAGSGALALHELLDAIKGIPGIGSVFVSLINLIESFANPNKINELK